MNSFNLMQVLILGELNFRTGVLDTHILILPSLLFQLVRGQEKLPGPKLSQNNHRARSKEDNFLKITNFSRHHFQWIAAALLFNKYFVSKREEERRACGME